jgi:hypothetical protein
LCAFDRRGIVRACPPVPDSFFVWLKSTTVAQAIAESVMATALLSAMHLVGFTLLMGSVLISALRQIGAVLTERPASDCTVPADRAALIGLLLSMATGLLLFSARAPDAAANSTFQLKMLLLASAAIFHVACFRRVPRRADPPRLILRLNGAAGLALWVGVALAGCAYILLE